MYVVVQYNLGNNSKKSYMKDVVLVFSACHPTCKECSGPSQADCTVCPPHTSLHNGYCRTSCPEGQYLNALGYCSGE